MSEPNILFTTEDFDAHVYEAARLWEETGGDTVKRPFIDAYRLFPQAEVQGPPWDEARRRYWYACIVFDLKVRDCNKLGFWCMGCEHCERVPFSYASKRFQHTVYWHLAWGAPFDFYNLPLED